MLPRQPQVRVLYRRASTLIFYARTETPYSSILTQLALVNQGWGRKGKSKGEIRNPNDERQMPKEARNPNDEGVFAQTYSSVPFRHSSFELRHSFDIRISGFGFRISSFSQAFSDLPHGLAEAIFVFHQRQAHVALAGRSEPRAGADDHVAVLAAASWRTGTRSFPTPRARGFSPKRTCWPWGVRPASRCVPALRRARRGGAGTRRLGLDRGVGVPQGHDGGDLDRPEHAVIVIALDRR